MAVGTNNMDRDLLPEYGKQCRELLKIVADRTDAVEFCMLDRELVSRDEIATPLHQLSQVLRQMKNMSALVEFVEMEREAAGLECYVADLLASTRIEPTEIEPLAMAVRRMQACLDRVAEPQRVPPMKPIGKKFQQFMRVFRNNSVSAR